VFAAEEEGRGGEGPWARMDSGSLPDSASERPVPLRPALLPHFVPACTYTASLLLPVIPVRCMFAQKDSSKER